MRDETAEITLAPKCLALHREDMCRFEANPVIMDKWIDDDRSTKHTSLISCPDGIAKLLFSAASTTTRVDSSHATLFGQFDIA